MRDSIDEGRYFVFVECIGADEREAFILHFRLALAVGVAVFGGWDGLGATRRQRNGPGRAENHCRPR